MNNKTDLAVQGAITQILPSITPFLKLHPYWDGALMGAIGLYGVYLMYNQEKINEFIEFIKNNPTVFRKEIVESQEFKDGFLLWFENYLKVRGSKKKLIAQKILLGYTVEDEKEKIELEKLNNALLNISLDGLNYIKFLKINIFPYMEKELIKMTNEYIKNNKNVSFDYWLYQLRTRQPITKYIYRWNHKYNNTGYPNRLELPQKIKDKMSKNYRNIEREGMQVISEFISLGIFSVFPHINLPQGGHNVNYSLTNFGNKFFSFIEK